MGLGQARLRILGLAVVATLVSGCGKASVSSTSRASASAPSSSAAPAKTKGATKAASASVPELALGAMTAAPAVSAFKGSCTGIGFPSGGQGSFATPVSAGGHAYVESTTFNIGYTPKAFYYCARVRTPVITASATGAGAATWTGDDMEFWLAPTDNRGQVRAKDTYQLLFNPAGGWNNTQGTGDAANPFNFKWASHTQFKLSVDGKLNGAYGSAKGWSVLASVPWVNLGLTGAPKPGAVMGFNTGGCIGATCASQTDWLPGVNGSNWHTPALWGKLKVK